MHSDHQGSNVLITDESGKAVSEAIYDPFGKRTTIHQTSLLANMTILPPTDRGYTGHKHIDALDIIHMGGRIYDPTLGRFLQADPYIQAPGNSQNYNRFSYVLNNPMSYTDPSGYFFKALGRLYKKYWQATVGKVLRGIASVPILNSIVTVGLNFIPGCQGWCSAIYSAASTYAVTGSLGAGLRAGAVSFASSQALQAIGGDGFWGEAGSPQNVFANAMVGGIGAELGGGKFGHGFFAAGVTSAFKPMINDIGGAESANSAVASGDVDGLADFKIHRVVAAGVIGGTASKIAGGKFANGAVTGAFTQLFNAETQLENSAQFVKDNVMPDPEKFINSLVAAQREKALMEIGRGILDLERNSPKLLRAWLEGVSGAEFANDRQFELAVKSLSLDVVSKRITALGEAYSGMEPVGLRALMVKHVVSDFVTAAQNLSPVVIGGMDFSYTFDVACRGPMCSVENLRFR